MAITRAPYQRIMNAGDTTMELVSEVPRGRYYENPDNSRYDWRPNTPFNASLRVLFGVGSTFRLYDPETDTYYNMFVSDMAEAIKQGAVRGDEVQARFVVTKKNVKYGLKLA